MASIMCEKRMRSCKMKNKKTLLSPLAGQVRLRSQLWGKITRLQSLSIRQLKIKSKTQDLLIGEHVKYNKAMKADLQSTKAKFKKLKTHLSPEEMELALKTAKGKRNYAIIMREEAEELLEKKKMELEELKNEMKNKI